MNPILSAGAFSLVLAPAAMANCPVGADLADGIYVTYDDESITRYTGTIGGEVVEHTDITDGSGDVYIVPTLSGLYGTGYVDGPGGTLDESTRETLVYSEDMSKFLPVAAGQQFNVKLKRLFADGSDPSEERYSVVVGQELPINIGGCSFTALPVTHTFVDADGVYGLFQHYLPELGIGVYVSYSEMGAEPDVYEVLEISNWAPK